LLSNSFGILMSTGATLSVNVATADTLNPSANGPVYAIAPQVDGKILLAGDFTTISNQSRLRLARLNSDGSLDGQFLPQAYSSSGASSVYSVAVQPDGKIIVGGFFTSLNGVSRPRIGRLNANGSLDSSFSASPDSGV